MAFIRYTELVYVTFSTILVLLKNYKISYVLNEDE